MESKTVKKKSSGSSNLLAPGFRFHPTDEELVRYYLRRKICGKPLRFNAISEIDIYKAEPWDLPYMSKLKTRDLEWYFFSVLDKKYGNGSRTNRATEKGYWKTTGKDRAVHHKTQVVGMKKTLVYHSGRAPKGQRTNWVMHEYRLTDLDLETAGISQDAFVLCRIFQKSGSGPKNGEQYGAPFVEEEWDNDGLEMVPEEEATEEVDFGCDAFLNGLDLQQILGSDDPSTTAPLPVNIKSSDSGDERICSVPASCDTEQVKQESVGESSKSVNFEDLDFLLNEPFLDFPDSLQLGDEGFIEANDFTNPGGNDTNAIDMLEEYLTFSGANDDSALYFANNPDMMLGYKDLVSDQSFLPHKVAEGNEQAILQTEQIPQNNNKDEALLSDKQESAKYDSGYGYPFIKKASRMLGNIQAPPAFAAEFPPKDAVLRLNQFSSPVHGSMIHLRNSNMGVSKNDKFNLVLYFGYSQGDDGSSSLESSVRMLLPGKMVSSISRGWLYFIFFWVLVLSTSFKIGSFICAN